MNTFYSVNICPSSSSVVDQRQFYIDNRFRFGPNVEETLLKCSLGVRFSVTLMLEMKKITVVFEEPKEKLSFFFFDRCVLL